MSLIKYKYNSHYRKNESLFPLKVKEWFCPPPRANTVHSDNYTYIERGIKERGKEIT